MFLRNVAFQFVIFVAFLPWTIMIWRKHLVEHNNCRKSLFIIMILSCQDKLSDLRTCFNIDRLFWDLGLIFGNRWILYKDIISMEQMFNIVNVFQMDPRCFFSWNSMFPPSWDDVAHLHGLHIIPWYHQGYISYYGLIQYTLLGTSRRKKTPCISPS